MPKEVRIRFRKDTVTEAGGHYAKDAEFDVTSADVAHKLYGDAIEIVSYADGEPFEAESESTKDSKKS